MKSVSESFAGRGDIVELETLSLHEIQGALPTTAAENAIVSRRVSGTVRWKSPKLYVSDTGVLCALLNIRIVEELRQSPAAAAVWETSVFAQLRAKEWRAGRTCSLFF